MNPIKTFYVQKSKEEDKKKFELGKKVKNNYFSSCSSFAFVSYTLLSPNLHIILNKNLHI